MRCYSNSKQDLGCQFRPIRGTAYENFDRSSSVDMEIHSASNSKRKRRHVVLPVSEKQQAGDGAVKGRACRFFATPVDQKHWSSDPRREKRSRSERGEWSWPTERFKAPPNDRKHQISAREREKKSGSKRKSFERTWVYSPHDCSAYKDRFVVVSYNILGVENASNHQDLYCQVPSKYLKWDRRKKLIKEELKIYKPSILCLQEVDQFDDLASLLGIDGYRGFYKGRTGDACDGCAIFWQEKQFTLLHQENIEFQMFGLRNNVAQLCVLKDSISRTLLVGNIHVLFNPKRGDIKLGQIRIFLEKAHELSHHWGNIPVVLAGDLNSMPQSAIYQFLASSELDILMHDRRSMSDQTKAAPSSMPVPHQSKYRWDEEELQLAAGSSSCTHIHHHLKLCSAYSGVPGNHYTRDVCGEPLATTYHSKFMGTVDYIWHSEELVPVKVVETLPTSKLRELRGLPSKKWGSDHFALVCELAYKDDCKKSIS